MFLLILSVSILLQPVLGCSFLLFIEDHRVALGCCFHLRSGGCVLDVFPISSLYSMFTCSWIYEITVNSEIIACTYYCNFPKKQRKCLSFFCDLLESTVLLWMRVLILRLQSSRIIRNYENIALIIEFTVFIIIPGQICWEHMVFPSVYWSITPCFAFTFHLFSQKL